MVSPSTTAVTWRSSTLVPMAAPPYINQLQTRPSLLPARSMNSIARLLAKTESKVSAEVMCKGLGETGNEDHGDMTGRIVAILLLELPFEAVTARGSTPYQRGEDLRPPERMSWNRLLQERHEFIVSKASQFEDGLEGATRNLSFAEGTTVMYFLSDVSCTKDLVGALQSFLRLEAGAFQCGHAFVAGAERQPAPHED
jgi:hypothetical protein